MEENMQHFQHIMLYFKKDKNTTEMQKRICAVYGEGAVTVRTKVVREASCKRFLAGHFHIAYLDLFIMGCS